MARPKTRAPESIDRIAASNIDESALETAGQALAMRAQNIDLIASRYAPDMPYDFEAFVMRGRDLVIETGARLIELGLILIQIREREPHGRFLPALERIGVAPRFAQRAMQAAVKMRERPRIAELGVTKALELVAEDDDTLAELEDGGTLAGLTLDEIDRLTVRELKATLRAERAERAEEKAADEDIIRKKDERINKLARRATRSSQREAVNTLLEDLDRAAVEIATYVKQMLDTAASIDAIYSEAGETVDEEVQERVELNLRTAADRLQPVLEALGE